MKNKSIYLSIYPATTVKKAVSSIRLEYPWKRL